jgi:hypothetical protein
MDCQETGCTGPYRDGLSARRAELEQLREQASALNQRITIVASDVRRLSRPIVRARRWRAFVRGCERLLAASALAFGVACFAYGFWCAQQELKVAKVQAAQQDARTIMYVSAQHFSSREFDGKCPTVKTLVAAGQLAADPTEDPWGSPFRIECGNGQVHVYSNGPDELPGTADDIRDDSRDLYRLALR